MKPDRKAELLDKGFLSKRAAEVMKRAKNLVRRQEKEEAAKQGLLSNIEEAPALVSRAEFSNRQPRDCGFDRAKRQRQEQFFGLALG
ncbi:hypothetical protein ACXO18_05020 [Lactobacillus delbrueckii subsp. bulgaricus]